MNFNYEQEMVDFFEDKRRKNIDLLAKTFAGMIKQSFLKKMLYKITGLLTPVILDACYPETNEAKNILTAFDDIDYDVCSHIVGVHRFNTLGMNDNEISELYNNVSYQNNLVDQVLEQIKLRMYGSFSFRKMNLFSKEKLLYFPVLYDYYVSVIYIDNELDKLRDDDNDFFLELINNIMRKALTVLSTIDYNVLENAYGPLRAMLELITIFLILSHNPDAVEEYLNFLDYKSAFTLGINNSNFINKYKEKNNVNIRDYLNYGWIDSIFEFGYLDKKDSYSFTTLTNFLDMVAEKYGLFNNIGTKVKDLHKICHNFTHGNLIYYSYSIRYIVDVVSIFHLCFYIIVNYLANTYNIEFNINDVNLMKRFEFNANEFNELIKRLDDETLKKTEFYF